MHGTFNFNSTPLALPPNPGTKVMIHKKPDIRGTFARTLALNIILAWYIGPALHHYQCYRVWVWDTSAKRIADTLT